MMMMMIIIRCYLLLGLVTIATQLDYDESPNRTFIVIAYDNGSPSLSSTATVLVQLVQINKYPPVFDPVRFYGLSRQDK